MYKIEIVGSAFACETILYLNPAPESPIPAMPASRWMGLLRNHNSRFLNIPHFSSPLMFWWPFAASNPYSISNTPRCTASAVVASVGRFGTAVISSWLPLCVRSGLRPCVCLSLGFCFSDWSCSCPSTIPAYTPASTIDIASFPASSVRSIISVRLQGRASSLTILPAVPRPFSPLSDSCLLTAPCFIIVTTGFLPPQNSRYPFCFMIENEPSRDRKQASLCTDCVHARRIESARGSVFFLCELSLTDPHFAKYPRLPVISCSGYARGTIRRPEP